MKPYSGQAMVEFLVVLTALLLLILGSIQAFLVYQAKAALNYAVFEATRAGALENASRIPIEHGFSRAFAPLFARSDVSGNKEEALASKVLAAREFVRAEIKNDNVRIELISPSQKAFNDFADPDILKNQSIKQIPNNHLSFRSTTVGSSGVNIQDANLIKLQISYCMKLIVPFVDTIFSGSVALVAANQFEKDCTDDTKKGSHRMPITAQAVMRMQSPAIYCAGCFDNY